MKQFEPRKDVSFGIVFFSAPVAAWLGYAVSDHGVALAIALIISTLFLWIWYGTTYHIDDEIFFFRCGPFNRRISIKSITQVEGNVRAFSGMRPALSFSYMLIRYNDYDDVYIAPKDEHAFIKQLLRVNPAIHVAAK